MRLRGTLLAGLAVVIAAACGDAAAPPTSAPPPAPAAGWRELPPSPLSAREGALAFWTGAELLVIGGSDAPPCPAGADCVAPDIPALRDGAALDLATGRWRAIAPAPVPLWPAAGIVVDGAVYVWQDGLSPRPESAPAFLAYHPAEDRWERLPVPDAVPEFVHLAPAGGRIAVYQPTQEHGVEGDWLFDPATGGWSELPPDPLLPAYDRSLVWTGTDLVLAGIELAAFDDPGPNLYAAARLDPDGGEWRRLLDSEIVGGYPAWHLVGGRFVNPASGGADGGVVNNFGRSYPFGGALDLATEAWLPPLPQPPGEFGEVTGYGTAGGGLLLNHQGWVLVAADSEWIALPAPPGGAPLAAAVAWAGDELVLWGGVRWTGSTDWELLAAGWAWRPGG